MHSDGSDERGLAMAYFTVKFNIDIAKELVFTLG